MLANVAFVCDFFDIISGRIVTINRRCLLKLGVHGGKADGNDYTALQPIFKFYSTLALLAAIFSCLSDWGLAGVLAIHTGLVPGLARQETQAVACIYN